MQIMISVRVGLIAWTDFRDAVTGPAFRRDRLFDHSGLMRRMLPSTVALKRSTT